MKTGIKNIRRQGFTLTELTVATVVTVIVILGVAVVMVNSQRAYQVTYEKVHADVMTDGFVARKLFDTIIRKSSTNGISLGDDGESIEVHYYSDDSASYLDRYVRFYTSGLNLIADQGIITLGGDTESLLTHTVCGNVINCVFARSGNSARMVLELDDEKKTNTVVTSAYMHN